jgi:glutamate dehydrogenase
MRALWFEIEALDNAVAARVQYDMFYRGARLLRHTTYGLLRERGENLHIENTVRELKPGVEELAAAVDDLIGGAARELYDSALAQLTTGGVPEKLARRVACLAVLEPALDIVAMARKERQPVTQVARAYFELGVHIGLDWLHHEIDRLSVDGSWQATARAGLRDSAMRAHREITLQVLRLRGTKPGDRVARWSANCKTLPSWQRTLAEMRAVGTADFATLTVGVDAVRDLSSV